MTDIDYFEKITEHKEQIAALENLLSGDLYKVTYRDGIKGIGTSPIKMSEKLAFAFTKLYTKRNSGKAGRKELLKEIDDPDAEKLLDYFERWPRKWIETEGESLCLRNMFRTIFRISHDYKTTSERIEEIAKEMPAENNNGKIAEEIKEGKIEKKPEKKNRIKEYFERTKGYLSKDIRNSLKASSRIIGHLEDSIETLIKPTRDFLNNRVILRNYHLVLILPAFLAGMYLFGSREKVIKPIMKFEEKAIYGIDETSVKAYYGAKNLGIENYSKIKRGIKNACISSGKGIKNACKYVVRTSTTAYDGLKEGIKNSDIALYFAKKGKDSVEGAAKEGKELFQGYINEKVDEDLEKRKIEEKSKKK